MLEINLSPLIGAFLVGGKVLSSEQAREYEKHCVSVSINKERMEKSLNSDTIDVKKHLSREEILELFAKEEECQDD